MAALSDQMLVVAMLAYLVAMMCYAAEWAFGDRGVVARVASRELVGAATAGAAGGSSVAVAEPPAVSPARGGPAESGAVGRPRRGRRHAHRDRRPRCLAGLPRHRRRAGAVGQHVRVHPRRHVHRRHRLGRGAGPGAVRPPGGHVRRPDDGGAARRRRAAALHTGRPAGAGARLVLAGRARHLGGGGLRRLPARLRDGGAVPAARAATTRASAGSRTAWPPASRRRPPWSG